MQVTVFAVPTPTFTASQKKTNLTKHGTGTVCSGTYRGEEFSCSLKASLVVGPGEGLHMMKLGPAHCHSLR